MSFEIYLVEDEQNLNHILSSYFKKEGWHVRSFVTGETAIQVLNEQPHLWILDIMLPDIDGFQLLREIKEIAPHVPVIFISARDTDLDRIIGLELGGDDYLSKPFLPRELILRTKKLLERIYIREGVESARTVHISSYHIDESRRRVTQYGNGIEMTSKEFDLLELFVKNRGKAFSREQIITHVWGNDYFGTDRSVDDLIRRLRKKLPEIQIETMYGYGYRLI